VVLYRLLSGHLPFNADTAISMVQMQISEAPTPIAAFRPELPAWCSAILERALAKSPADRFQSAEEFRAALRAAVTPQALGEMPTLSTPTPPGLPLDLDMTVPHRTPTSMHASSAITSGQVKAATSASAAIRTAVPPPPTPTNTPPVEKTTTVVLGRTHLIALAALLVIVVTGIALLAFAALRGRAPAPVVASGGAAAPESTPAPAESVATGSPPVARDVQPASTGAPPPATPPVPAIETAPVPAPPKTTPAGSPPARGERGVATAGAAPAASKAAARGTTSGVSSGGSPTGGRGAGATDVVTAPAPSPPPPAPVEPPLMFKQVRLLVAEGERVREREGTLQLGDGRVSIVTAAGGAPVMSVSTDSLTGIFYARSKQPRWRDANGQIVESKLDLGRLGFFRGERNWVVLLSSGEPVIFRIEDSAMKTILPALQERTGHRIQR
jgi:serine/threonine-protein kinase